MSHWIAPAQVCMRPSPGRVVARLGTREFGHAEFRTHAASWRAAFETIAGQQVALYFDNAADFAAALYGAWHAGKTPVLCADPLPETLARLMPDVGGFAGDFPAGVIECIHPIDMRDTPDAWPALDEETTRLVLFTSGSTGVADAIEKRLRQLAREVEALEACFGEHLDGCSVHGTVSHQHIYGLLFQVLWPLAAGRPIMERLFFHEEISAAIRAPAILVSSPAHLKRIPVTVDWSEARKWMRAVFSSGGALAPEVIADARRALGLAVTEIYGSSETGGIAWRRDGEAWKPLPGVSWRIADGRLEVRSAHLPDAQWWCGADRVEADGAGGFRLLGRADRIVKVEERRVSLTALEDLLQALPAVAEARVVLLEGARAELAAVVVPSAQGSACLARSGRRGLGRLLSASLADAMDAVVRPRRWRFVSSLPMNAQGKTTDAALRALFRPERPQPCWLERESEHACLLLELSEDLVVFDGHFPQAPILPGVAQVDWAVRFAREAFALPPRFLRLEALKFQRVARPGLQLRLQLDWLPAKATLAFRYESSQGQHASGRVVFAPETET